jgi:hypothetical protein
MLSIQKTITMPMVNVSNVAPILQYYFPTTAALPSIQSLGKIPRRKVHTN